MKKVLIFSDSHGENSLMEKIINFEEPDIIIHCGDHCLSNEKYLNERFTYYVRGNNDSIGIREHIFKIENLNFLLTHGDDFCYFNYDFNSLIKYAKEIGVNVALIGHSHKEEFIKKDGITIINPGSISFPRNVSHKKTYAVINVDKNIIIENRIEEVIKYI